jgi:ATP-binding cassette subfamily B protein
MASRSMQRWRSLSRLYPYLYEHRRRLVWGVVAAIFTNVFLMAGPRVMGHAINSLEESVTREKLLVFAGMLVGLTVLEGVSRFATRWLFIGASRDIEYSFRNDVFRHLESLSMSFYQRHKTGDLMSRSTNDLSNVRMLLGPGIMYSINTSITATIAIAFMISISWKLTLFSLLPLPVVPIAVRYFGRRINKLTEESQERLGNLSARVQENTAGARVVKAFVQEDHEVDQFRTLNNLLVSKNFELINVTSVLYPLLRAVIATALICVLWFGGRLVISGEIRTGDFVAFLFYLGTLSWPMIALGWVTNLLERGRASMERLNYVLDTPPEITDSAGTLASFTIQGTIEFRNLDFSYGGTKVLKGISLLIPAGRTLAIVGATGSGKSTLVQLIPRLFNPPPNSLFIDDVPVERIPLATLRRSIGYIPQDTFLFGDTVRENIAFGIEEASDAAVLRAAEISNIHADIAEFPKGFDTVVGERGITLSGGQKQRTAISRAVIRNPAILILDDALSSVDTYTEENILRELRQVMTDRTSILISHRVSTVKDADEIVVIDKGEIVERGTHGELLAAGGYYADLYRRQLLEEELAVSD